MSGLENAIEGIRRGLEAHTFVNEASVSQGIVLPILQALGWSVFDTAIVQPEYVVDGGRVDYALCHPKKNPVILIEVKKVGKAENADEQLFRYAFKVGVPVLVLTDGRDWSFYFPSGSGNYAERRFYKIDLLTRDLQDCVYRFQRYLSYSGIANGDYRRNADADFTSIQSGRTVKQNLPIAFANVVRRKHPALIDLLREELTDLVGFDASDEEIVAYLDALAKGELPQWKSQAPRPLSTTPKVELLQSPPIASPKGRSSVQRQAKPPKGQVVPSNETGGREPSSTAQAFAQAPSSYHMRFKTEEIGAPSASGFIKRFFQFAVVQDPAFGPNFMKAKHGSRRRYLSADPEELFPGRKDLQEKYVFPLPSGLYLGLNMSARQIKEVVELALKTNKLKHKRDYEFRSWGK